MRIDNKNIQGIYKFDSSASYDRGDIVVSGNKIYICLTDNTSGIEPETSTNYFKPYFGLETINTYEEYVNDTSGRKLMTTSAVESILSHYFSGINKRGIIVGGGVEKNTLGRIDDILRDESLNNAIYTVSPDVIPDLLRLDPQAQYINPVERKTWDKVILRQYTYISDNKLVRVQELLDHTYGDTFFRSLVKEEKTGWEDKNLTITPWKVNYRTLQNTGTNDFFLLRDVFLGMLSYSKSESQGLHTTDQSINRFCYSSLSPTTPGETLYISITGVSTAPQGSNFVSLPKSAILKYSTTGVREDATSFTGQGVVPTVVTITSEFQGEDSRVYVQSVSVDLSRLGTTDTVFLSGSFKNAPGIVIKYTGAEGNLVQIQASGGRILEVVYKNRP